VDLRRHLVHAQLDDRHIRRGGLQPARQPQPLDAKLRGLELLEASAEMDQHQVALVAEQRDAGRGALLGRSAGVQGVCRLRRQGAPLGLRQRLPVAPANPEHLVQQAPAFERLGNARVVHVPPRRDSFYGQVSLAGPSVTTHHLTAAGAPPI
jgi:hypothetical protein